jgi:hypothetical protein
MAFGFTGGDVIPLIQVAVIKGHAVNDRGGDAVAPIQVFFTGPNGGGAGSIFSGAHGRKIGKSG